MGEGELEVRWREIRINVLALQGIIYRVFIIVCQTIFVWVLTGRFKLAVSFSLVWNVVNMMLYYLFHYTWARMFKLGCEEDD